MGTTEATLRMEHMEVKDEWQDEDFPRLDPCAYYLVLFHKTYTDVSNMHKDLHWQIQAM